MTIATFEGFENSRPKALLDHFAVIEDPRGPWRVAHPLPEVLFLVVCGTICDCDDYDLIADWGAAHPAINVGNRYDTSKRARDKSFIRRISLRQ